MLSVLRSVVISVTGTTDNQSISLLLAFKSNISKLGSDILRSYFLPYISKVLFKNYFIVYSTHFLEVGQGHPHVAQEETEA